MAQLSEQAQARWQQQLAQQLDGKIKELVAAEPTLLDQLRRTARTRALERLQLEPAMSEWQRAQQEQATATAACRRAECAVLAAFLQIAPEDVSRHARIDPYGELEQRVAEVAQEEEIVLAAQHAGYGLELSQLLRERQQLAITVAMAGTTGAMRSLWSRVCQLTGAAHTPLQMATLSRQ